MSERSNFVSGEIMFNSEDAERGVLIQQDRMRDRFVYSDLRDASDAYFGAGLGFDDPDTDDPAYREHLYRRPAHAPDEEPEDRFVDPSDTAPLKPVLNAEEIAVCGGGNMTILSRVIEFR